MSNLKELGKKYKSLFGAETLDSFANTLKHGAQEEKPIWTTPGRNPNAPEFRTVAHIRQEIARVMGQIRDRLAHSQDARDLNAVLEALHEELRSRGEKVTGKGSATDLVLAAAACPPGKTRNRMTKQCE